MKVQAAYRGGPVEGQLVEIDVRSHRVNVPVLDSQGFRVVVCTPLWEGERWYLCWPADDEWEDPSPYGYRNL